ncbi:MAG TPA: hypothetical protein VFQ20_09085 [Burkholderiaceae bacterium]|nr:hypothetical protein [Burkholderiaceae bacterium]
MKSSLALALALAVSLAAGPALAQTSQPAAKPAAKPAKSAKGAKKPAPMPAPVEEPLAPASDEQKAAATIAHLGDYACEFDQTVSVLAHAKADGYLDVRHRTSTWVMKPVLSSTGALRLEDVKGRLLMIQIANKSMLMDTQLGQRLVDGCMHDKQREFAKTMDTAPGGLLGK